MNILSRGAVVCALLLLAATISAGAWAKKPSAYAGVGGATQNMVQNGSKSEASPTSSNAHFTPPAQGGGTQADAATTTSSTLPFTGMDLGLFVLGGVALVVAGYSLNRRGRQRSSE
jgi:hypothetical protein